MSLAYSNGELKLLAMRWDTGTLPEDEKRQLWEQMSIQQRKLFKRMLDKVDEKKLHAADSYVTKRQMVGYMAVLIESKMMPLAANLDEVTRVVEFLALPFYKRWWRMATVTVKRVGRSTLNWLDRRGIHFVQLDRAEAQEEDDAPDGEVLDHARALGGEAGPAGPADPDLRDGREEDRLPQGELEPEGDPDERTGPGGVVHRERRAGAR